MKLQYITIVLLVSFIFFCKGASFGMIGHSNWFHTSVSSHMMECCDDAIDGFANMVHHDVQIGLVDTFGMLSVLLAVFFSLLVFHAIPSVSSRYMHVLRISRGSPIIFSYLHYFLSGGLLHPKEW